MVQLYTAFEENTYSKIFPNDFFGYFSATVEQPERNDKGEIVKDKNGKVKADSRKRSTERIPLTEKIQEYFKENIIPHVPDAFPDPNKIKIGYEINFSKYFYQYVPLRPSKEIQAEIEALEFGADGEKGISSLIKELFDK